jgi:hypothetical protein
MTNVESCAKKICDGIQKLIVANNYKLKEEIGKVNLMENDKFFLWHTFFADIFNRGGEELPRNGFDIVIGNPPFVNVQLMSDDEKKLYRRTFESFFKKM